MSDLNQRVAALLATSMRAHLDALAARHGRHGGDNSALLTEARDARLRADAMDPSHTAEAWAIEQLPPKGQPGIHEKFLAFYDKSLA